MAEQEQNSESRVEAPKASAEQIESIEKKLEKNAETNVESQERSRAEAQRDAMEQAVSVEAGSAEKARKETKSSGRRHGAISKKEKEKSFKKHMERVQSELPAGSRAFSKLIHNKVVEKTSDTIGSTIARPDAILSGAVAAFILVLIVYVTAKIFGYVLSGFETIGAFLIGWALGIIYDYLKIIITGKTS